jgi:hypothetical protein
MQHKQLLSSIPVALRLQRGTISIGELRQAIIQEGGRADGDPDVLGISDSCWAFIRNIRGRAAYWSDAGSDLFAMLRATRPPTWFVTLSSADMGWNDLAIVLAKRNIPLHQQEAYIASLSKADKAKLFFEDQVSCVDIRKTRRGALTAV